VLKRHRFACVSRRRPGVPAGFSRLGIAGHGERVSALHVCQCRVGAVDVLRGTLHSASQSGGAPTLTLTDGWFTWTCCPSEVPRNGGTGRHGQCRVALLGAPFARQVAAGSPRATRWLTAMPAGPRALTPARWAVVAGNDGKSTASGALPAGVRPGTYFPRACLRPGAVTSRLTTPVAWVQAALTTLPLVEGNRAVGTRLGPYLPARDD
jgi:hypothetical protein